MHNKDFENKVQQKMQELRFNPSDEVWRRVEAGIEAKKRKRRFAFWMLLPLIVGAGFLFLKREAEDVRREASGVSNETAKVKGERSKVKGETAILKNLANKKVIGDNIDVANYSAPSAVKSEEFKGVTEVKEVKAEIISEELISQKIKKPKSKWSFGMEASAGLSSFSKGLLQPHAQTAGYYYDPVALNNTPTSVVYTPSAVKQGFAFSAGIFASRSISKKLGIRFGLSYLHASTSMKVGQKIDSARAVNQSNMSMDKVDGYYSVGTSNHYTNKYTMLGFSASVDWHITRRLSWQNGINFARLVNSNALHFDGLTGSYYEDDRLFNKNQVLASSSIQFNVLNKISVGPEAKFALTDMLKNNMNDKKHLRYIGIKSVFTLK